MDYREIIKSMPAAIRPERFMDADEARKPMNDLCNELFPTYDRLHSVVLAHEATIRKRWNKKTAAKRRALLQEAYPNIPLKHAPEVQAFKNTPAESLHSLRDTFLLYFVNVEDLTAEGGAYFLSLLHHRSHLFPSFFVQYDTDRLHFGIVSSAIKRVFVEGCSVLCYGDRSTYGKVVDWEEDNEYGLNYQYLEFRGDALHGSDALVVFEAQSKLIAFLSTMVEKILWDVDLSPVPVLDPATKLSPPDIPVPKASDYGWASISRQHNLRAYLDPGEGFSLASLSTRIIS
ncbi:hypothetical protein BV25DRAFT_1438839 [Artomyces pyxidatus]|uniref:Uncharacterized protein n=1 Tax=Artomyces pyxidatus TaxID=48021 RepID=A0ACB8SLC4_9AGAM|nr:hypothetical protein BV25DRAFT_1438839 [Artomyces pyxidatus]